MTSQKQLLFAYGLAVHLFIVGIVCYTTFSTKAPEEPIRLMYKTAAGKVLFDHDTHCSELKYGSACSDCHHHPSEDDITVKSCRNCHQPEGENATAPEYCLSCHELEDVEDVVMLSSVEAFHNQCVQCHKEIEVGPQKCSHCHVL